jgi:hypothetical protein
MWNAGRQTDMARYGLLCITFALLGGCSGAQISLDHFSEDYGQAPPVPEAGGSGPPGFGVVFEPPADDFTIYESPTGIGRRLS